MWGLKLLGLGKLVGGFFSAKFLSIAPTGALVAACNDRLEKVRDLEAARVRSR